MYGIWDNNNARFVFDIKEPTKAEAIRKFKSVAPSLWKRWRRYGRYKAKEILTAGRTRRTGSPR